MSIVIRSYTMDDFEGLLEVQREAFPPPFPEELWWSREQIASQIETFPEGAMIATLPDGTIIGSATSLIIQHDGKPHTWAQVADDGYIRKSHQPDGDSLYGIDVCVRPAFRKLGVAKALYEARKQLVTQLGLTRFLAGCRIPGYHRYAGQMSEQDYVEQVRNGALYDQVLSFMLKQGLRPIQVLENYVEDEESLNFAVLVEWRNPAIKE